MAVVATAGHVDHGKSTLVRALTGTDPDRLAEEKRRGLTIELGYAWTTLPSGRELAVVDVPGHERFIGTMLAGLGPSPAVVFVVAADAGWSRQSAEHLAAADALGVRHGLLVVTRTDLADDATITATERDARRRLAASSLGDLASVRVSAVTGAGLDELRSALDRLLDSLPQPDGDAPVRFWIDRSFRVRGSGTVVTGTLTAGTLHVGDALNHHDRSVTVRGLQTMGRDVERATPVNRVAINLRIRNRCPPERGEPLLTPDAWLPTTSFDARLVGTLAGPAVDARELPAELVLHVGTAHRAVHVRALEARHVRVTLRETVEPDRSWNDLPIRAGDRAVLRDPGRHRVAAGLVVLDPEPPGLRRRGAATVRGRQLALVGDRPTLADVLRWNGSYAAGYAALLGFDVGGGDPAGSHRLDDLLVDAAEFDRLRATARDAVAGWARDHPLDPGMPVRALARALTPPPVAIGSAEVVALARHAGLPVRDGRIHEPGAVPSLGPAAEAVVQLTARLRREPFVAPDRDELTALGLGARELATAHRLGQLLRLPGDIVLLPDAPHRAADALRPLSQPFTAGEARQAWHTTRRVAVPLLEHLDELGLTERLDGTTRRLRP